MTIRARDTVSISGTKSGLSSAVASSGVGNGANINIQTGLLSVTNGALLATSTLGEGDAGSVTITASDTVSFDGVNSDGFSSGAFSTVQEEAVGNGGGINITTGSLSVTNGALLSASTFGEGNAGNIQVSATESVELIGTTPDGQFSSGLSTDTYGAGAAGDLRIDTGKLIVRDGAVVNVSSTGSGNAGNLEVTSRSIHLDNQGKLTATTASGKGGGNITLQDLDLLLMRRNSDISTNAGGIGNGGNIDIDTDLLVALENSDITANAFEGQGGNVKIDTQGDFRSPDSDITASSELGPQFEGLVEINTPDVDLSQGLVALPVALINTSELIANSCIARSNEQGGSFIITGTGGLPPRPGDAYVSPFPTGTVRSIPSNGPSSETPRSSVSGSDRVRPWKLGDPIVEAQGLYRLADGQLVLSRECPH